MTPALRLRAWWPAGVLALLTLVPYLQTSGFDFLNFDDERYVLQTNWVLSGLTFRGIARAFLSVGYVSNWHPMTWLSLMTDVSCFGVDSGAMHLVSACIHAVNAVLLYGLLRLLTRSPSAAFLAAACWALHPLRVESVAWISERKDVLSGAFGLAAVWVYLRWVDAVRPADGSQDAGEPAAPRHALWEVTCLSLAALAIMSKPTVLSLPPLLALTEYALRRRISWRRLEMLIWMAAIGALLTYEAQRSGGGIFPLESQKHLSARLVNACASVGVYLGQTLYPHDLIAFYPWRWPLPGRTVAAGVLACAALAAAIWGFGLSRSSRARGPAGPAPNLRAVTPYALGAAWFGIALVPMIGIVSVGRQAYADRYTYWPSIGLAIALAWAVAQAERRFLPRTAVYVVGFALAAVLVPLTERQVRVWRNQETLFQHAIDVMPDNALAQGNLGVHFCGVGRAAEGLPHLQRAVALDPTPRPRAVLALGLIDLGRAEEAACMAQALVEEAPKEPAAWTALGLAAHARGDQDGAERALRRATELQPTSTVAWNMLGVVYAQLGRWTDARDCWLQALKIEPLATAPRGNLLRFRSRWDHSSNDANDPNVYDLFAPR